MNNREYLLPLVATGALLAAAAGVLIWRGLQPSPETASPVATASPPPVSAPRPQPARPALSFDIVRVDPQGNLTMAGRSEPGARVDILDGDKVLGTVTASGRGEWVFSPDTALPPGRHDLQLRSVTADGRTLMAAAPVTVSVPDQPGGTPLAVKRLPDGGSIVLLGPVPGSGAGPIAVGAVDYADGRLAVSGTAPKRAKLRVYLDGRLLGDTTADDTGLWRLPPRNAALSAGHHTVRVDQILADGKVTSRIEVAFTHNADNPAAGITIEPGNSLWRIARQRYGRGAAYTLIYQANKGDIRDPNLIYPGQVFTLPKQ